MKYSSYLIFLSAIIVIFIIISLIGYFNNKTTSTSTTKPTNSSATSTTDTYNPQTPNEDDYWVYCNVTIEGAEGLELDHYGLSKAFDDFVFTELIIPESVDGNPVISLGENAFCTYSLLYGGYRAVEIHNLFIPQYVQYIHKNALIQLGALQNIEVDPNNQYFKSVDGNLYSKDGTELIKYCPAGKDETSFVVPEGVTTIWPGCFTGSALEHITLPSTLKNLGYSAFSSCNNLLEIVIPEGITSIQQGTFLFCKQLKSITLPSTVSEIQKSAFYHCEALESINIPHGVTSIGQEAFYKCYALKNIVFPETLVSIDMQAFWECNSLSEIIIPDSVTKMQSSVFSGCDSLSYLKIGTGLKKIPYRAFSFCQSLQTVIIPTTVETIDGSAFVDAKIESLYYLGTLEDWMNMKASGSSSIIENVQKLYINGEYTVDLELPEGFEEIPYCSFSHWHHIESVRIPKGTKAIGTHTFGDCSSLQTVYIPLSVTEIKAAAFYNCTSLKTIYYEGTKEQWKAIVKDESWDLNLKYYKIECADGYITIYK